MQSFAIATIVSSAAAAISADKLDFANYAARFNKFYESTEEFMARFERFVHHHRLINEHNATEANFTLGHNQFSDWTDAEYEAILGYRHSSVKSYQTNVEVFDESNTADSVNWVDKGGVTPVKDQGRCGSCWAFATIGAMESAHFAKTGELLTLSEQQLIDCDIHDNDGYQNKGCHGGDMYRGFEYFKSYSPSLESVYPYTSGVTGDDSTSCLYSASDSTDIKVQDIGYMPVGGAEVYKLKAYVQTRPVSVAVSANNKYIHSYESGVIDAQDCTETVMYDDEMLNTINHGVLIVGYGNDEATGLDYWLIKNSWNTTWGDKGYAKIKMVDDFTPNIGICGVQAYTSFP